MEKATEKWEKVQNHGYKMMRKDPNAGAGQFLLAVLQSFNSSTFPHSALHVVPMIL
jgi:hypothetical protein